MSKSVTTTTTTRETTTKGGTGAKVARGAGEVLSGLVVLVIVILLIAIAYWALSRNTGMPVFSTVGDAAKGGMTALSLMWNEAKS